MQRLMRDYYEHLYANKVDNIKEVDRFLGKFNTPKQNQEEIEIMNKPITSTEIKAVIKTLPPPLKENIRARWLHRWILSDIYKRANAYPSLTLPKIQRTENFQTHSEATVTLVPKPDKDITKKENITGQYHWWI